MVVMVILVMMVVMTVSYDNNNDDDDGMVRARSQNWCERDGFVREAFKEGLGN